MLKGCISYYVFIASPSDSDAESETAYRTALEWNARHTSNTRRVMIPVRWTHQMIPMAGKDPQLLINEELLEHCDLLVGIFKGELGATRGAEREVRYFIDRGRARRVMLFVHRDDSLRDPELRGFVDEMKTIAFLQFYESEQELQERLEEALARRAQASLAAPHVDKLRDVLLQRTREWRKLTHVPVELEPACSLLALAAIDLSIFSARDGSRITVDARVRELTVQIEALTRDVQTFVDQAPWDEAESLVVQLVELVRDLPEEDDLL